jgi:phosphate starvation-inducible PhoH-like protein
MAGHGARLTRRERRQNLQENVEKREKPEKTQENTQKPLKTAYFHPKSPGQALLKSAFAQNRLVFAHGPAGTGKTLLAVDRAVDLFASGLVKKLVFARPAVEAGERLGTLPGGIREKLDPFLRPLFDELANKLGGGPYASHIIEKWLREGTLEIAPIGMMRGRTFRSAAIVVDEMQNATYNQWKMVVTRLGEGSSMFITGDPDQLDPGVKSGMVEALDKFAKHEYPVIRMGICDVQRDPIVSDVLKFL